MVANRQRFEAAIEKIDAANREDPHREVSEGKEYPKELLYSQRMSEWLKRLEPGASEAVRLAARAQHIQRWKIPRRDYPMNREGYRRWRTDLGKFHAETASRLLREADYDDETIAEVQSLLRKERLKANPDCQLLEDIICLVFLDHYSEEFIQEQVDKGADEEKLLNILKRTWKKMSDRGREAALKLDLPPELQRLVEKAVAE